MSRRDEEARYNTRMAALTDEALRSSRPVARDASADVEAPPGSYARLLADFASNRDFSRVRDIGTGDRQAIDRLWQRLEQDTRARFGRSPATDELNQPNQAAVILLRRAHEAESAFLSIAGTGAAPAAAESAFNAFISAATTWLNHVVSGWPPRAEYEATRERSHDDFVRMNTLWPAGA